MRATLVQLGYPDEWIQKAYDTVLEKNTSGIIEKKKPEKR